jgi:hypothetical protein
LALSDIYTNLLQPLHIAVKLGHLRLVKLIVEFTKSTILIFDVDGQTTLHAAVKLCSPQITSILLAAAGPKGLQMEDSVGNTPFDIMSLNEINFRIHGFTKYQMNTTGIMMSALGKNGGGLWFHRYSGDYIQKLQKELLKFDAILDVLFADGRLKSQTKLAMELTRFASMMKERLSAAEAALTARLARFPEEASADIDKDPKDAYDVQKTSSIVVEALKGLTVNRQLIHLIDVQKSVEADLEKVGNRSSGKTQSRCRREDEREGGLEAEQDEELEVKEKAQSMVWHRIASINAESI